MANPPPVQHCFCVQWVMNSVERRASSAAFRRHSFEDHIFLKCVLQSRPQFSSRIIATSTAEVPIRIVLGAFFGQQKVSGYGSLLL